MKYFINIKNGKADGVSQINNSRFADENNFQIEIDEETYNKIIEGKIYKYENDLIVEDVEAIKNTEIKKLKKETENEIFEIYPIVKQLDIIARIGGYTDDDFDEMKSFIEEKMAVYQIKKNRL